MMKKSSELIIQLILILFIKGGFALLPRYTERIHNTSSQVSDMLSVFMGSTMTSSCTILLVTDVSISSTSLRKVSRAIRGGSSVVIFEPDSHSNSTQQNFVEIVHHMKKLRQMSPCIGLIMISEEPSFLAELSRSVDQGRLILWETKVLVVTKLPRHNLKSLLESNWVFSMANTMILNFDDKSDSSRGGVYSYLPYGSNGEGQLVRIGRWSEMEGLTLLSRLQLYPQKYQNFYGAEVGMTVWPFMPYFMVREEPDVSDGSKGISSTGNDNSNYTGRDYIMLETMSQFLNFSIKFIPTKSWEEVIQLVKERVSFMSPMKLAIMPHLLKELDFTVPIEPATLTFSMAKPILKPRWQSLYYPLKDDVWASILAMMILMPAVFIVITNKRRPSRTILKVTGSLLGQNFYGQIPERNSGRLLVGAWLVFAFILGTAYRGNLTAFLTIPKYPPRAETLPQLLAKNAKVAMPPDAVDFYNGFKQSPSSEFRTLSERVTFVDSFREGLGLAETSNSAYMYERRFMELMIARHFTPLRTVSRLYVARHNVWPGYSAWPIIRDAPFKPVVNRCIQAFNEAGLIDKWGDMVVEEARRISRRKKRLHLLEEETEEANNSEEIEAKNQGSTSQALTIVHMQGPLFLLLLGLAVAGLVFAIEALTYAWHAKH